MTGILNFESLRNAAVQSEPFPYFSVEQVIRDDAVKEVIHDFPALTEGGSFNLDDIECGAAMERLVKELDTPEFRKILTEKFEMDVMDLPMMITLRGISRAKDGRIHADSKTKVLTILIYMNEAWTAAGGRLRILRGEDDMEDYAAEVAPGPGTLLAFKVTDNCWHGYPSFEGKRQSIQINFLTGQNAKSKHRFFHGLSAKLKKLGRSARH